MSDDTFDVVAVNGVVTRRNELRLADFWSGFAFGAGLFETMLLRTGKPMFLEEHLERLRAGLQSEEGTIAPPPADVLTTEAVARAIGRCLDESSELGPHFTGAVKLVVSDGRLLVTFRPYACTVRKIDIARADRNTYRRGDSTIQLKSISYLRQYRYMGAPLLFVNEREEVCETPIGNLFFLWENAIVTPTLEAPCLPGIIRSVLLKMKTCTGMRILERDLTVADLKRARGCVMTNSLQLATQADTVLGIPMPGSAELAARFREQLLHIDGTTAPSPNT